MRLDVTGGSGLARPAGASSLLPFCFLRACVLLAAALHVHPCAAAPVQQPQTLGTWFPNYGDNLTNLVATPAVAAGSFSAFRGVGGNTVYVDVYHAGVPGFPSPSWEAATGRAWNASGTAVDYLGLAAPLAKAHGLTFVAWFEWGTMLGPELLGSHPEWSLGTDASGFVYGDPSLPAFRAYLVGLLTDALAHPAAALLDGVQLDDHFCWPAGLPRGGGGPPPATKQGALTALLVELAAAVRSTRPGLLFSLAPNPAAYSTADFNAPWPAWLAAGTVDEAVVQLYTWSGEGFATSFAQQEAAVGGSPLLVGKLKAGILLNNGAQVNGNATGMMEAELAASGNASTPWAGQVLWYARGVLLYRPEAVAAVWSQAQRGEGGA